MSGTTTNNGWTYPTSTDYVKDGATAIQTLATGIDTSTGKGLLAWQAYTPTTSATVGNGTITGAYAQIGKTVHFRINFTIGSTSSIPPSPSGILTFTVPVTATAAAAATPAPIVGGLYISPSFYPLVALFNSTTVIQAYVINAAATNAVYSKVVSGTPAAYAAGSIIYFEGTYEAA